jgi:uncharacterized protein (DUF1499 family)
MKRLFPNCLSLYFCFLLSASCAAGEPAAKTNQVMHCPDSPNCVSSLSTDKAHFIEPLQYAGSLTSARRRLINILQDMKRVHLAKIEAQYIHAEFRSLIFRFIDDVEFYFPSEENIVHIKSASRMGYYDFGVNRRRVERLRSAFEETAK